MIVKRHVLDEAMREMLASVTRRPIGLMEFSEDAPEMPYGILYPLGASEGEGSWADPGDYMDFMYQVTSVGQDPRQVNWMSSEVRRAMVQPGSSGQRYLVFAPGVTVEGRWGDGLGSIVSGGKDLYQIADTYRVRAS